MGPVGSSAADPLVAAWCAEHLGSPAVEQVFGIQRLSAVHGVRLADGREVAVKVRGTEPRQAACALVQAAVWAAGVPCPQPLAGPLPLATGPEPVLVAGGDGDVLVDARGLAASAETWEGEGFQAVGDLGAAGYARILARIVAAAPPARDLPTLEPPAPWLWWDHGVPGRTWPPPASHRWDPHRVDDEMPAIVHDTARRSRERLLRPDVATLPVVVGHGDFEAQNCRWVPAPGGAPRFVVHDWDSVMAMPEAVLAGNSAFTYASELDCEISTIEGNDAFLAAYAEQRGRPWSALEWQVAHAAGAWVGAYNAAFEHLKGGPGPVTAGLREQAELRLRRAGA